MTMPRKFLKAVVFSPEGRVEGPMLIFSCENSKITTLLNSHQGDNVGSHQREKKKMIPRIQGQMPCPNKLVGGTELHLESNPISTRDALRAQANFVCTKSQRPHRE